MNKLHASASFFGDSSLSFPVCLICYFEKLCSWNRNDEWIIFLTKHVQVKTTSLLLSRDEEKRRHWVLCSEWLYNGLCYFNWLTIAPHWPFWILNNSIIFIHFIGLDCMLRKTNRLYSVSFFIYQLPFLSVGHCLFPHVVFVSMLYLFFKCN